MDASIGEEEHGTSGMERIGLSGQVGGVDRIRSVFRTIGVISVAKEGIASGPGVVFAIDGLSGPLFIEEKDFGSSCGFPDGDGLRSSIDDVADAIDWKRISRSEEEPRAFEFVTGDAGDEGCIHDTVASGIVRGHRGDTRVESECDGVKTWGALNQAGSVGIGGALDDRQFLSDYGGIFDFVIAFVEIVFVVEGCLIEVGEEICDPATMFLVGRPVGIEEVVGGEAFVNVVIVEEGQADLVEVVTAGGASCGFASLLDGREEEGDQEGDDGDDDEEFDERKGTAIGGEVGHGS